MHGPERTCVGCRRRRPQGELLRLRRRTDGEIVPARRVGRGRSVYLCALRACYDGAVRRRALTRGFRGTSSYDAARLWTELLGAVKGGPGDE